MRFLSRVKMCEPENPCRSSRATCHGEAGSTLLAYDTMLVREKMQAARGLLRVLGLLDRPISANAVKHVAEGLFADEVGRHLQGLSDQQWLSLVNQLAEWSLVSSAKSESGGEILDTHPLVREYFGSIFKHEQPHTWQKGHLRLYDYLRQSVPQLPDSAEDMSVLYLAVAHGCHAGIHQRALEEVFYPRIRRENQGFSTRCLGMFDSDLAALSGFLGPRWTEPVEALSSTEPPFLLNEASVALQALGNLEEARNPLLLSLELVLKQVPPAWKFAAIRAGNLTELSLALGDVDGAQRVARNGLQYATASGNDRQRIVKLTRLASVLHIKGETSRALDLFREAERLEGDVTGSTFLSGREGALFCELLLTFGRNREVTERMQKALPVASSAASTLATAHVMLCLGKASMELGYSRRAETFAEASLRMFKESGYQQFYPLPLLLLATVRRAQARRAANRGKEDRKAGCLAEERRCLDDVLALCDRTGMRLHKVNALLRKSENTLDAGDFGAAADILTHAQTLIDETGYRLAEPVCLLGLARLGLLCGRNEQAAMLIQDVKTLTRGKGWKKIDKARRGLLRVLDRAACWRR